MSKDFEQPVRACRDRYAKKPGEIPSSRAYGSRGERE